MGLLANVFGPFQGLLEAQSTWVVVTTGLASLITLVIVLNVLNQLLFKNPHEPPVVFHWVPFIGNTISYGMDPYKFFFACREKVCTGGQDSCAI